VYKIDYNYHDSITRVTLTGNLSLEEIKQLSIELLKNITEKHNLILTDARHVNFDFKISGLSELYGFIEDSNKNLNPDNMVFEAVVTNTPKETAITIIFNVEKTRFNHVYNIFSTESAAINWLLTKKNI
jgi:hypothetical protein